MAARKSSSVVDTSDRELVMSRVLAAPRERVFRAWTDPEQLEVWWGPNGFTNTTEEIAVTPGGVWRFVMHGPDGVEYPNLITYDEVVEPERIVYAHGGGDKGAPANFHVTVTFQAIGRKTELTMRMVFPTAVARDHVVKAYGAIEGGKQTLGRLAELLARGESVGGEFVFTRVLSAPRARVFKAWTDPELLARWWGPEGFTNPVCEVDLRPGGAIRIDMRGPDGTVYPMTGQVREIVEPERLVFVSAVPGERGKPIFEVLNTVTFEEDGRETTLTVRARVISRIPEAARYLGGMNEGWTQSLGRLDVLVSKESR